MKKKYIILICFIIFLCFYYIFFINGNTIFKKENKKITENILDSNLSYAGEIEVTIYSNKNENTYTLKQEETSEHSYQEVVSKGDANGLTLEYKDGKLIVKNTELNLEKIYENYSEISNNYLFLKTFIREYEESEEVEKYENEGNYIVSIKLKNGTKYIEYKELYINKDTGMPEKLIIKNSAKQETVCIKYISLEIF